MTVNYVLKGPLLVAIIRPQWRTGYRPPATVRPVK